jgi:hypothetical protein
MCYQFGGHLEHLTAQPRLLRQMNMENSHSDAFAFFGATGDLAR